MTPEQREQVRRILDYKTATSKHDFSERRAEIYARNSSNGCLQSGATVRQVVRTMEETAGSFISYCLEQIGAVARDTVAFADLLAGFDELWSFFDSELHSTIKLAGGALVRDDESDSTSRAARNLLDKSKRLLRQRLELYRFTFTQAAPEALEFRQPSLSPANNSSPETKAGRPLAEHWDDMWAAVAFALYNGDLNPKSQADIEGEMQTWLEAHGFTAATSTVRGRARRLWDRLQDRN